MSQNMPDFECITVAPTDQIVRAVPRKMLTSFERKLEMRTTVNNLRAESQYLKHEVAQLKSVVDVMYKQSGMILTLLREHHANLGCAFQSEYKINHGYLERFPISSLENLKKLEADINDMTQAKLVATVRSLITPAGLQKRISEIFSNEFTLLINMQGLCGKYRLLDYPNFIDLLYKSMGYTITRKQFMKDLHNSLRLNKRRIFKNQHDKRKAESVRKLSQQNEK